MITFCQVCDDCGCELCDSYWDEMASMIISHELVESWEEKVVENDEAR